MRAIGFAALTFGAVIALSATLGMSYRSDASPYDDPATTASDSGTPTGADSGSPASETTAPPATADASAATPDPSSSPTADDPAPTDDPGPAPQAFAIQAFDVTPPVTYAFAPSAITATIDDDTADGGEVQLFQHVGTEWVASGSPVLVTGPGQSIPFTGLGVGTWNLTTTDYYGTQIDFRQFTVQATPTITSLRWGSTVELRGTGAAYPGVVISDVLVTRTDGHHPEPIACTTDPTPVDSVGTTGSGTWVCNFAPPTDTDTAVYQVATEDQTGGVTALSNAVSHMTPAGVIGWDFAPNSVTAVGFDLTGEADTGSITYQPADLEGAPSGAPQAMTDAGATYPENTSPGGSCSAVPSAQVATNCEADFPSSRPSGLWAITTAQTEGSYPTATDPATYVFVPPAPTLHVAAGEGRTFSGTGLVGDTVIVADGNGGEACEAEVFSRDEGQSPFGSWYCTAAEFDPDLTYTATQIDAGNPAIDGVGPGITIQAGGISLAAPLTPFPELVVDQQLHPAAVTVTAQQGSESRGTSISFYHYASDGDTVNWYEFPFSSPHTCPAAEGSPVQGANVCELSGLEPGPYESYVVDDGPASSFDSWWVVPETPSITSTVLHSTRTVTLSGTGVTGDAVRVIVDGSSPACDGTVVSNGQWTCTVPALSAGRSHSFQAYLQDIGVGYPAFGEGNLGEQDGGAVYTTGGISAPSATTSVTIAAGGGTTTTIPDLTTLATWFFNITGIDLNNVHPGDTFTVTGTGLTPGSTVSGELHSKAISIGSTVVEPDGSFRLPVTVPADFPVGAHQIVMTLTPPGSSAVQSVQPMTVVPAKADSAGSGSAAQSPSPEDNSSPLGGAEQPGIDGHGPNSNILTHGLDSIADVLAHPAKVPAAIEIGLVLLIFAVLPGHLLNATLAEQYERFTTRRRQRPVAPGWWARLVAFLRRAPFLAGVALTTLTALLFGFADPRFGFTLASLRLFLGLAIALAIVSYLTNAVVGRIMRGRWKVEVEVSLRPLGLILTVVGVVVSRLLDFSPGFLIGLVLGLVISEKQLVQHAWRAVLLRTSILLGLSLLAWLAFSLFDAKQEGGTFASELAIETLVAITTEAVVSLLVELLPLRLLEGEKLYEKSKLLWSALYLVTVVIFVVAVVPWEGNWATLGSSLWTWIGIVVGFGIVATGVYLYFRIRTHDEVEHDVDRDEDEGGLVPISSEDDRTA